MYQENKTNTLPVGQIQPQGWLLDILKAQMEGITGELDENWSSVSKFSDWMGGTDNSWERPPYWLDGLVPLAYLLKDHWRVEKAEEWMEYILSTQREDGDFGPTYQKADFDETLFWPKMVMLKACISYYEAKNQENILVFMERYVAFCGKLLDSYQMNGWGQARGGDLAFSLCWLYEKRKNPMILTVLEKVNRQTLDWSEMFENYPFTRPTGFYYKWKSVYGQTAKDGLYEVMQYHATHIVNVAMGLKQPVFRYKENGNTSHLDALYKGIEELFKYHGQVTGVYAGDEHLNGTNPTQGTELCSVVEMMFSLQQIFQVTRDASFLDLLERVAYNALPATITEDFRGHQYDQQANQMKVSMEPRNWYNNGNRANLFGFEPNFGCCLANLHQGWPKFVKNAFFVKDKQITAGIFMSIEVSFQIQGTDIRIKEETEYPFRETVNFLITTTKECELTFSIRIPGWCEEPKLWINGEQVKVEVEEAYLNIHRNFQNETRVSVEIPMKVRQNKCWYHQGMSIERGPLIYVLNIQEDWKPLAHGHKNYKDYEVFPVSAWNYALSDKRDVQVRINEMPKGQPFSKKYPPVELYVIGARLPSWQEENNSAGNLPKSPVHTESKEEILEFIPYGCSKLRISVFPWY